MQWDEGVQAPTGDEFTVVGRRRGEGSVWGRSLYAMIAFRNQWEVRVDSWPRSFRRAPKWRVIVSGDDAERLVGELLELIRTGRWMPGEGEPPVDFTARGR